MARPRAQLIDIETYPHKYVRPKQLADYVDVSLRTIYYHIQKGALHAVKIGGVLRIPTEIAKAYIAVPSQQNQ